MPTVEHHCRAVGGLPEVTMLTDPPGVAVSWACAEPTCSKRGAMYFMADDQPRFALEWD